MYIQKLFSRNPRNLRCLVSHELLGSRIIVGISGPLSIFSYILSPNEYKSLALSTYIPSESLHLELKPSPFCV